MEKIKCFNPEEIKKNDIKLRVPSNMAQSFKIENTLLYQDIIARDTNNFMKDFDY